MEAKRTIMLTQHSIIKILSWVFILFVSSGLFFPSDSYAITQGDVDALLSDAKADRRFAADRHEKSQQYKDLAEKTSTEAKQASQTNRNSLNKRVFEYQQKADAFEIDATQLIKKAEMKEARANSMQQQLDATDQQQARRSALLKLKGLDPQQQKKDIKALAKHSLNDFLGLWQSESGHDPMVILPQSPEQEAYKYRLEAHTNDRVWQGTYTPFQENDLRREHEGKIELKYTPTAEEINPAIPEWARKQIVGKLEWKIQLSKNQQCGQQSLLAKWYPGEVQWLDSDNASERRAWVAGDGKAREQNIVKVEIALPEALASSVLLLRLPHQTDVLQRSIEGLLEGQLFHIDVYLPYDIAKQKGEHITVNVKGLDGGNSGSIKMRSGAIREGRPVRYTQYEPIVLGDKPMYGSQSYIAEVGSHWQRLDLNLVSGEIVEFSFDKAKEQVRVYQSPIQRKLARHMESIPRLRGIFSQDMLSSVTPPTLKESAHLKLQMLKNMELLLHKKDMPEYLRLEVAELYQNTLLSHDYSAADYFEYYIHGNFYREDGSIISNDYDRLGKNARSPYYDGVVWNTRYEKNTIISNIVWKEKQKVRDALHQFHKDISYALYDWTLESAGLTIPIVNISIGNVGELFSVFTGKDPYGKKLKSSERQNIAASIFFSSLLDWSQGKYMDRLSEKSDPKRDLQHKRQIESHAVNHQKNKIKQQKSLTVKIPKSVSEAKLAFAEPALSSKAIDNDALPPVRCAVPERPDSLNLGQHDTSDLLSVKAAWGENATYDTSATPEWAQQQFQTCNQGAVAIGHAEQTGTHFNEIAALKIAVDAGVIAFDSVTPSHASHPFVNGWKEDHSIGLIHALGGETIQIPHGHLVDNNGLAAWRKKGWRIKQAVNVKNNSEFLHSVDVQKFNLDTDGCLSEVVFGDSAHGRRITMPADEYNNLKADYPLLLYRFRDQDGNLVNRNTADAKAKSVRDASTQINNKEPAAKTSDQGVDHSEAKTQRINDNSDTKTRRMDDNDSAQPPANTLPSNTGFDDHNELMAYLDWLQETVADQAKLANITYRQHARNNFALTDQQTEKARRSVINNPDNKSKSATDIDILIAKAEIKIQDSIRQSIYDRITMEKQIVPGLLDAVNEATESGVPFNTIAANVDRFRHAKFSDSQIKAIREIERAHLQAKGLVVLDVNSADHTRTNKLNTMLTNALSGNMSENDIRLLHKSVNDSNAKGRDFFDEIKNVGSMGQEEPFELLASPDEIERLRTIYQRNITEAGQQNTSIYRPGDSFSAETKTHDSLKIKSPVNNEDLGPTGTERIAP